VAIELGLDHKSVVITGGCRGIGRRIATAFLECGAQVVVCCRHRPAEPVAQGGRQASFVEADVRRPEDVERVMEAATQAHGRLDVLVNNAGGSPPADAATASPRFSASVVELNLLAPLYCAQAANRVMQAQDEGGSIVNVASLSGLRPSPGTAAYGAAKAGLINLTRSLAIEWAPKVRVNAVAAGIVRTEAAHLHYGDEATMAKVAATIPLGRMGDPDDVAHACLFLSSKMASFVSGACLVVDGGGERPPYLAALDQSGR
jgi:NAD(P)-dependent dehydrogenase (short-subunit alcohol dehydrogenase family)